MSFAELGTFSLNSYPFSVELSRKGSASALCRSLSPGLKLLWAPVVDAVYSSRLGRRRKLSSRPRERFKEHFVILPAQSRHRPSPPSLLHL